MKALFAFLLFCLASVQAFAEPVRVAPVIDAVRSCDKPHYPVVSRRMSEQGAVVLGFLVNPDGSVQKSKVLKSSGVERLDQAALDSLSQCRFNPATIDGQTDPEPAWAKLRYVWKLDGEGQNPAPGDRNWYTIVGSKDLMVVVDETSATSKDGVVSFIQSEIFYTMKTVKEIGDTPVRRFDSLSLVDCVKKTWGATTLAFINDTNQVISAATPGGDPHWTPIEAGSGQEIEFNLFCLGHYNSLMHRKDKDIYLVQQTFLNAAKGVQ